MLIVHDRAAAAFDVLFRGKAILCAGEDRFCPGQPELALYAHSLQTEQRS
jgi:hypothetical protein